MQQLGSADPPARDDFYDAVRSGDHGPDGGPTIVERDVTARLADTDARNLQCEPRERDRFGDIASRQSVRDIDFGSAQQRGDIWTLI